MQATLWNSGYATAGQRRQAPLAGVHPRAPCHARDLFNIRYENIHLEYTGAAPVRATRSFSSAGGSPIPTHDKFTSWSGREGDGTLSADVAAIVSHVAIQLAGAFVHAEPDDGDRLCRLVDTHVLQMKFRSRRRTGV
jgi:hypothetical protein